MRYVDGGHVAAAILKQRDIRYASTTCIKSVYYVYRFVLKYSNCSFITAVIFSVSGLETY